jgi:hypothetical protein
MARSKDSSASSINLAPDHDGGPRQRMGDMLVGQGSITAAQREELVVLQSASGRPIGALAEEYFDVPATEVERAWAAQYASMARRVSAAEISPELGVRGLVTARQAWQFRVVPLRVDRDALVVLTSQQHLVRAHKFAFRSLGASIGRPVRVELCDDFALLDALERYYRMDGAREFVASAA